jgi:hypothetical protein
LSSRRTGNGKGMFLFFKFCWIINRIGVTIFKRRPQSKIRICLSSAQKMSPRSSSSHQTNKWSQNESEKKNRENYRNRFHFQISLVSTAQFRQTKTPSQETRNFKKVGKFWSESFYFFEKFFFRWLSVEPETWNFANKSRCFPHDFSMFFCTRPDPVLSQNNEISATIYQRSLRVGRFLEYWKSGKSKSGKKLGTGLKFPK